MRFRCCRISRADKRDLLPRRLLRAVSRPRCRPERRTLADTLPRSGRDALFRATLLRVALLRVALLREGAADFFFPKTLPEKQSVTRINRISGSRRVLGEWVFKFMRPHYLC